MISTRNQDLVSELLKRFSRLKQDRAYIEPVWREVADLAYPRLSNWDTNSITFVRSRAFNSRALYANKLQAYGFLGYMMNRAKPWFRLRVADRQLAQAPGVSDWLEEVTQVLVDELQASNFYDQAAELVPILGSIGTAAMSMQEDPSRPGRAFFSTRHPKECWFAESNGTHVDTCYRQFRMVGTQAMKTWKEELPAATRERITSDPYGFIRILHVVQPREEWNPDSLLSIDKPFGSYYIDLDSGELIAEGGYDHFPYVVPRWVKNADEVYGGSPAMDALTDILRLNQVSRTQLELAQKIADPPTTAPETMRDSLRLNPGSRNFRNTPDEKIEPLVFGANYPITKDVENSIREIIDGHFNVEFFLMLSRIDREMTAREVLERKGEQSAVLGATIGNFQTEFLSPAIEWLFNRCVEWGKFPPPPQALQQGGTVSVEYTGYLAQLQQKYYGSSGLTSALEILMPIIGSFPQAADNIDVDELVRAAAEAFGLPQKIIRELPEVQSIRVKAAQAAAAQQNEMVAMQNQQDLLKNADKLNQPTNPESPLAQLQRAMKTPPPVSGGNG